MGTVREGVDIGGGERSHLFEPRRRGAMLRWRLGGWEGARWAGGGRGRSLLRQRRLGEEKLVLHLLPLPLQALTA